MLETRVRNTNTGYSLSLGTGGTPIVGGTVGSVLFIGAGPVLAQNNAQFFWDNVNNRLGIGTASPASGYILDARGNLRVGTGGDIGSSRSVLTFNQGGWGLPAAAGSTSTGDKIVLYDPGVTYRLAQGLDSSARWWFQSQGGTAGGFSWWSGSTPTQLMVLQGDGVVGIGTSPASGVKVHIAGVVLSSTHALAVEGTSTSTTFSDPATVSLINTDTTANNYSSLQFSDNTGASTPSGGIYGIFTDHANNFGDIGFFTRGSASGYAEKMRITSAGNVGIGTTSPSTTLHVVGVANATAVTINADSDTQNTIALSITGQQRGGAIVIAQNSNNAGTIQIPGGNSLGDLAANTGANNLVLSGRGGIRFINGNSATSATQYDFTPGTSLTASSGTQVALQLAPTLNQSGTAAYTALLVNATETATGSGTKNLLDLQKGGTSKFRVSSSSVVFMGDGTDNAYLDFAGAAYQNMKFGVIAASNRSALNMSGNGYTIYDNSSTLGGGNAIWQFGTARGELIHQPQPYSAGAGGIFNYRYQYAGPADTGMVASTENNGFYINASATRQWLVGALTTQREVRIDAPTYAFTGASTITDAATVAITGAPVAGTNATITNSWSLWVQAGNTRMGREYRNVGTAIATTDWVLTSGWGANATISAVSGNDSRGTVTVTTSALDTPGANPVLTLTFKDGTWTTTPFAVANMDHASTGPSTVPVTNQATATTLVISYRGTPTATSALTYKFNYLVEG